MKEHIVMLKEIVRLWRSKKVNFKREIPMKQRLTGRDELGDLRGADLTGRDLSGRALAMRDMRGAICVDANCYNANMNLLKAQEADFSGADLERVLAVCGNFERAIFRRTRFGGENPAILPESSFKRADMRAAILEGVVLRGAKLERADLRGANLERADLRGANLKLADLRGANLLRADLRGADLRDADLRGAITTQVNIRGAQCDGVKVSTKAAGSAMDVVVHPVLSQNVHTPAHALCGARIP